MSMRPEQRLRYKMSVAGTAGLTFLITDSMQWPLKTSLLASAIATVIALVVFRRQL